MCVLTKQLYFKNKEENKRNMGLQGNLPVIKVKNMCMTAFHKKQLVLSSQTENREKRNKHD